MTLPYYNPLARLFSPYRRFEKVEAAIERPLALPGVMIVPLKTTARLQWRNLSWGRVSRSGCRRRSSGCAPSRPGRSRWSPATIRWSATGFDGHGDTTGGGAALAALAEAGADAVLSGHVHDPFDVAWPAGGRSVRLIGAGTLSQRLRTAPPSFNELVVADGELTVTVRAMA